MARRYRPNKAANKNSSNLLDPKCLTTPSEINEDIINICKKISEHQPFFIDIEPELWARQSCCDLNVNEYIKLNGGQKVCGYKVWYNKPNYIELERHAIWLKDGIYKDITFNTDGEDTILFIPDTANKQANLDDNNNKIRWGKNKEAKDMIKFLELQESIMPICKMSDEDCWNRMLTYEQWKSGKRMHNMQIIHKNSKGA